MTSIHTAVPRCSLVFLPSSQYFDIKAAPGEKLRLALVLSVGKAGFEDDRVKFADW